MEDRRFVHPLLRGESILWAGRPVQGLRLTPRDSLMIPFSLMWGGFAVLWEATVIDTGRAPLFFALWGIPFVLVGVYLIVGRFVADAWLRARTRYTLTSQRVVIERSGLFPKLLSISLERLTEMELRERRDGSGTIRFGLPAPAWPVRGFAAWSPALDPTPQFIGIEDARKVFDIAQQLRRGIA